MKNTKHFPLILVSLFLVVSISLPAVVAPLATADQPVTPTQVGTTLPADFPVIENYYLGVPVIGFGSDEGQGRVKHVPIIFLHGNNDTPFPTTCNPTNGKIQNAAQYFLDNGYSPKELWGLGYQGDQCDRVTDQTKRSGVAHSTAAAVPALRSFVRAVLKYTHAKRVDIVAHSLGVTVAREWMLQDQAYDKVRALVAVDGPNHGIISCSPSPLNFYNQPAFGGFTPNSAVCEEYGSDHTPFLLTLNSAGETPGPTQYLVIRNVGPDFVYSPEQDGVLPGVPAMDRDGEPHDFSDSALLAGATTIDLTGQGQYDETLGTSHLGILNSPDMWKAAFDFLKALHR